MKNAIISNLPGFTTIQEKLFNGRQSVEFVGIYSYVKWKTTTKLKVDIDRDSYDFQSSAIISVWHQDKGWLFVTSITFAESNYQNIFCYTKVDDFTYADIAHLRRDTVKLLDLAIKILY